MNKKPRALSLRAVRCGDRLEPAAEGLPDLLHGENIIQFPQHLRKVLLIRRPKYFPYMFIWRLFCIPGFFRGIPGLRYEHCLFDGMHTLELGILPYLENMSFWYLIMASFWGQYSADGDNSDVELAFNRDLKAWYNFAGIDFPRRIEFSFTNLGEYPHGTFDIKAADSKVLLDFVIYCM